MKHILIALTALLMSHQYASADERLMPYIEWIAANSSLEYNGEPLPTVKTVDYRVLEIYAFGAEFVAQAEREGRELFEVHGLYHKDTKEIWFPDGVDPYEDKPTLVHELVHWMQDISGTLKDCAGANEREAYELHWQWVQETGYDAEEPNWLYVFMLAMSCEEAMHYRHDSPP